MKEFISQSCQATRAHARDVANWIVPGQVILLYGDLGAGKTEWVKGFVQAVGCEAEVTSPTFTLVHEYEGREMPMYHWDLYRLEKNVDWNILDLPAHMMRQGVTIIEWPERYPHAWPKNTIQVTIRILSENERLITCEP